ncbi:hypothetical protein DXA91_13085 [Clostridium sp. OF09-10]|nr:hypothetical protein DXA91_13085 [Clostridium sp. OF09-10]
MAEPEKRGRITKKRQQERTGRDKEVEKMDLWERKLPEVHFWTKGVNFKSVNFCCPTFLTRHSGTDIMNNCLIQTDEIL